MYRSAIILNIYEYYIQETYTIMQNILKYIPDSLKKPKKIKTSVEYTFDSLKSLKITGYLHKLYSFRLHHYVSTIVFRIIYIKNQTFIV